MNQSLFLRKHIELLTHFPVCNILQKQYVVMAMMLTILQYGCIILRNVFMQLQKTAYAVSSGETTAHVKKCAYRKLLIKLER